MQRNSPVLIATILLGVLALGATAFLLLGPKGGPAAPAPGTVQAAVPTATPSSRWVAARDIPPRTVINSAMMRRDFASGKVPDGAIQSLDDVSGKITSEPIGAGETVLLSSFTPRLQRAVPANIPIPTGYRGVAIWVDPDQTAAGLVDVGDRIDVIATHKLTYDKGPNQYLVGASSFTTGRTIAQDLLVLGVNKSINAPPPTPTPAPNAAPADGAPAAPPPAPTPVPAPVAGGMRTRVLVAALPDIAARLVAANDQGTLNITIRNPADGDAALVPEAREYPSRVVTIMPPTPKTSGGSGSGNGGGRTLESVPQPIMPPVSPVMPVTPPSTIPITPATGTGGIGMTTPEAPPGKDIIVIRGTEKSLVTVPRH